MVDGCRSNWLPLYHECHREMFWARYCSSSTPQSVFLSWRISSSVITMTPRCYLLCHPQALEYNAESKNCDLRSRLASGTTFCWWNWIRVKTELMTVSTSRTMHPQTPPLTIAGTVLKKSDDIDILGVTFDSKVIFEKHLHSVWRAYSQMHGIVRKSWRVVHDIQVTSWEMFSTVCLARFG